MEIRLDEQVAIVTGAGRGLGRAHAIALASKGAKVVVNDFSGSNELSENAKSVVQEIISAGGEAFASGANVANSDQVQSMVNETSDKWGRVDILVNMNNLR